MKSHTKRKSGFTLLEVIVSSVVLVIVFLSSLDAIQQSFVISSLQRDITLAGQIAQSKIEDLRLTPWANLSTANGNFNVSKTITIDGDKYTIRFPEEMANQSIGSTYQLSKWTELENRSNWHTF